MSSLQIFNNDKLKVYKSSSFIQIERDELSIIQQRIINSIIFAINKKLAISPYSLNKSYLHTNEGKRFLQAIDYAIPLETLKTLCNYNSKDQTKFLLNLNELSEITLNVNLFGKDKEIEIGATFRFFDVLAIDSNSKAKSNILKPVNDGYIYFSLSRAIQSQLKIKTIGSHILIAPKFKSKYSAGLYENLVDYQGTGGNNFGKRSVEELVKIIGGKNRYEQAFSKWKNSCLDVAIKEVNEITNIVVEIEEIFYTKRKADFIKLKSSFKIENELQRSENELNEYLRILEQQFFIEIKKLKSEIVRSFTNLYMLNMAGNFTNIFNKLENMNIENKIKFYENCIEEKDNLSNIFYSTTEKNIKNKQEIEKIKNLFRVVIYPINGNYEKFKFVMENEKIKLLDNFEDKKKNLIDKYINIDGIRRFMYLYNLDKDKESYYLEYNEQKFNVKEFTLDKFTIDNSSNIISGNLYERFLNITREGFYTIEDYDKIQINISNIESKKELIINNLKSNSKYFFADV